MNWTNFNKILFLSMVLVLSSLSFAQEKCDGEKVLTNVFNALNKSLCYELLNSRGTERNYDLYKCSFGYFGAGILLSSGFLKEQLSGGTVRKEIITNTARNRNKMLKRMEEFRKYPAGTGGAYLYDEAKKIYEEMLKNPKHSVAFHWVHGLRIAEKGPRNAIGSTRKLLRNTGKVMASSGFLVTMMSPVMMIAGVDPTGCDEHDLVGDYLYFDSNCQFVPKIGKKTQEFLSLSKEKQLELIKKKPMYCKYFQELASGLESQLSSFTEPKLTDLKCNSNGTISSVNFEWENKEKSTLNVGKDGDIYLSSSTNTTEKYRLDIACARRS